MAVKDWSTTAASNTGIIAGMSLDGTIMTVSQTDNAFRDLAAQIASQLGKMGFEGADIASATTTNLANATGWSLDITGTTTITGFGTVDAGQVFILRFTGALTLTHNATSLILPSAANITTAAGDVFVMKSEGSGNWRCVMYQPAAGYPRLSAANTWTGIQTMKAADNVTTTYPFLIQNLAGSQITSFGAYGMAATAGLGTYTYAPATVPFPIKGTGTNLGTSYAQFLDSAGTRLGYVGAGSGSNAHISLVSDIGDILLVPAGGDVILTGNLAVSGSASTGALTATSATIGDTTISSNGNLVVNGTAAVNGVTTITGNTTVNGTLTVTG